MGHDEAHKAQKSRKAHRCPRQHSRQHQQHRPDFLYIHTQPPGSLLPQGQHIQFIVQGIHRQQGKDDQHPRRNQPHIGHGPKAAHPEISRHHPHFRDQGGDSLRQGI